MHKNRAFTLIELLVVISIITMLITISLPVLTEAKVRAYLPVCSKKEQKSTTAQLLCMSDNNGNMPTHNDSSANTLKSAYTSRDVQAISGTRITSPSDIYSTFKSGNYLSNGEILLCPAIKKIGGAFSNPSYYCAAVRGINNYASAGWDYAPRSVSEPTYSVAISYNWFANYQGGNGLFGSARDPKTGNFSSVFYADGVEAFPKNQAQCNSRKAFITHMIEFTQSGKLRDYGHGGNLGSNSFSSVAQALENVKSDCTPTCYADGHVEYSSKQKLKPRASYFTQKDQLVTVMY